MPLILDKSQPAIARGIKTIGIGKKGSQDLPPELIGEIIADFQSQRVSKAAAGAFIGALIIKSPSPEELALSVIFQNPNALHFPKFIIDEWCQDVPPLIKGSCLKLLLRENLNKEEAYALGKFLMALGPGDFSRGLAASILRVRYETPDEYEGLLKSIEETFEPPFRQPVPAGAPIIQLAEPFDGFDNSYMLTPLVGKFLQEKGYRVVIQVGRNSGPKFGNNLKDLMEGLAQPFLAENADLKGLPLFGFVINQSSLSGAMDRWVDIRKQTIKRPFMSTLEKFVNPTQAFINIASAFHPPYGEKMITIAERAGFPGAIVVRNGLEGGIAFPLNRPAKILCTARQKDGTYVREEFVFDPKEILGVEIFVDERLENPSLEENIRLVKMFAREGKTDNERFNQRVRLTCWGIEKGIGWIENKVARG